MATCLEILLRPRIFLNGHRLVRRVKEVWPGRKGRAQRFATIWQLTEELFNLMAGQPGGKLLLTSLLPFTLALPYATSLQSNYMSLLARLPHQRPAIHVAC